MKKLLLYAVTTLLCALTFLQADNNGYRSEWSLSWDSFEAKDDKKIGLALGGGSVLGAAHIGVLRAIEEFGIEIDYIAGTSIGAFVSALYANGKHWDEIEQMTYDLDWLDLSGFSFSHLGVLSNKKMGDLLRDSIGDIRLEDSDIPVAMVATDIVTGEKVVLTEGSIARATMASTCIPGVFAPVEVGDRMLVDGGVVESVPITPLREMGAEFIIAVDLSSRNQDKVPDNIVDVIIKTYNIMSRTTTKYQVQQADIHILPDLSDFNVVDIDQAPDLIKKGYSEAMKALKMVVE